MRVWDCDPRLLCDKHLRAQHSEIHFAIRCITGGWNTKWKDVGRFRAHSDGIEWLSWVHNVTVSELQRRGKFAQHRTPVPEYRQFYRDLYARYQEGELAGCYLPTLKVWGYPLTQLNQGTPWERDNVTFEWYRENEKTWTRKKAEAVGSRNIKSDASKQHSRSTAAYAAT